MLPSSVKDLLGTWHMLHMLAQAGTGTCILDRQLVPGRNSQACDTSQCAMREQHVAYDTSLAMLSEGALPWLPASSSH